jgi:hypothetical protein
MRKEISSWDKQNTKTSLRLYQEEGKSFEAIGEAKTFGQFTTFELNLLYAQATDKKLIKKEKSAMKNKRGSGGESSKAGLENQRKSASNKCNGLGLAQIHSSTSWDSSCTVIYICSSAHLR